VTLHIGDCLDVMRTLPDASVDAVVTDPPYGLSFMGKRWDYDVPSVEVWAECLRVLKPGGHLLAFAGTRTQHRMAVRIEDAGFEIRDLIMWCYGSGFPKSLDVSKAIDKAAGAEREVVGSRKLTGTARIKGQAAMAPLPAAR
jgi:DNA modification methylase